MSHVATEASATADSVGQLLAIQNLTVRYGLATAVRNLDLSVNQGHALALLGLCLQRGHSPGAACSKRAVLTEARRAPFGRRGVFCQVADPTSICCHSLKVVVLAQHRSDVPGNFFRGDCLWTQRCNRWDEAISLSFKDLALNYWAALMARQLQLRSTR